MDTSHFHYAAVLTPALVREINKANTAAACWCARREALFCHGVSQSSEKMRVSGVVVLIGIVIAIDAGAVEHIVLVIRRWAAPRHDDAFWRYHHPVAVLPLDLFD